MGQLSFPGEDPVRPGDLVMGKPPRITRGIKATPQVGILIDIVKMWQCKVNHGKRDEYVEERRLWSVLTPGGVVEELESRMEVVSKFNERPHSNW